jgi:hypothetical protein
MKAIDFILKVAQDQITELEGRISSNFRNISLEEKRESLKFEAIYLYLKNFWSHYEFLSEKLYTEKEENFHFFLSILRILIELYGELLYFLNQEKRVMTGIFTGHYLLQKSNYYRFIALQSMEIKQEYERFLNLVQDVLNNENISFPSDIKLLSKGFIVENGFGFPQFETIFKQEYFKILSSETFQRWGKDEASNFYDKYYRFYSDYIHRSFSNQVTSNTKTEKYWIIQFLYIISQLMTELCNKKVFSYSYTESYKKMCNIIAGDYENISKEWIKHFDS